MPADTIAKQEENQRVMRNPEASFDAPFDSMGGIGNICRSVSAARKGEGTKDVTLNAIPMYTIKKLQKKGGKRKKVNSGKRKN